MILRLSQKLSARVKAGKTSAHPLNDNTIADWSAHLFIADRTQYVLLSNTKSLYSTVVYARGMTDDGRFIDRALSGIREFMEFDGHALVYQRFIAPACGTVRFAAALDRRVTGSMNDLVHYARVLLTEAGLSPFDAGLKLNETPLSVLRYGSPRAAFKAMAVPSESPSKELAQ